MGLTKLQKWIAIAYGAVGALAVAVLIAILWTAYVDHERTTAMWIYVNQQIAAKQIPQK